MSTATILRSARLVGCVCCPHIRRGKGIAVSVLHDDDCPAINAGSIWLVAPTERCAR